jgi:hypothetical protein
MARPNPTADEVFQVGTIPTSLGDPAVHGVHQKAGRCGSKRVS